MQTDFTVPASCISCYYRNGNISKKTHISIAYCLWKNPHLLTNQNGASSLCNEVCVMILSAWKFIFNPKIYCTFPFCAPFTFSVLSTEIKSAFGWLSAAAWSRCSTLRDVGLSAFCAFFASGAADFPKLTAWPRFAFFKVIRGWKSCRRRECRVWLGHSHPLMTLIHSNFSGVEVRVTSVSLDLVISAAIWLLWVALKLSAWCVDNEVAELCIIRMTALILPVVWHVVDLNRYISYHLWFRSS